MSVRSKLDDGAIELVRIAALYAIEAGTGATPGVVPTGQQSGAGGNPAAAGGAGGPNPYGDGVSANPDGSSGADGRPAAGEGANAGGQSASAGNGTAGAVDGPTMVAGSDQLGQGSGPSCGQPNVAGLPQSGSGNAGVAGDTANRPGSRGDDSGKLSGGVDQAGVSSNSQPGITFLPAKYSTWVNRAFGVGCGKIGRRLAKAPRPANHALPEALLGTRLGTNKVTVQKI